MAHAAGHHAARLPWTLQHSAMPTGSGGRDIGIAEVERLLPRFERARWGGGLAIAYPEERDGVFRISHVPDQAQGQRSMFIDPGNGRILRDIGWRDYSPGARAIEWGVMTHLGRQYGLANQLINLGFCLAIIGFTVAGIVAWWHRRPVGSWGAPPRFPGDRLPLALVVTGLALAALFPLVGASLAAIAATAVVAAAGRALRLASGARLRH